MTEEEYEARFNAILKKFGGSLSTPSGFSVKALFFSCSHPPIEVPLAHLLTPEQRALVVAIAEEQFSRVVPTRK